MATDDFALTGTQAWPTLFFHRKWKDHPTEAPGIIEHLYALKARSKENIASGVALTAKSGQGLYESDFDLFSSPYPGIRKLVGWIDATVRQVVSIANGQKYKPEGIEVEFTEAWSHITNDGGYHDAHYHGDCSWCGIFYVQAGESSAGGPNAGAGNGISRFYSPLPIGGVLNDLGNAYLSSNRISITPTDGLLLLFPAYLLHSGLPYRGATDRILIAFNTRSRPKT